MMISSKLSNLGKRFENPALMVRLMLHHHEVFHVPAASRSIRVVAGTAWVTVNGRDIFLTPGERLCLPVPRDATLISALGRTPLILEIFGVVSKDI